MQTKQITLVPIAGIWHARTSAPGERELLRLFGTATLPTPFMSSTPASEVLDSIARLNPGAVVVIDAA